MELNNGEKDLKKGLLDDDDSDIQEGNDGSLNRGRGESELYTPNSLPLAKAVNQLQDKEHILQRQEDRKKQSDTGKWAETDSQPKGIIYTLRFMLPFLWKGGFWIKFQVLITAMLIVGGKVLNVIHPVILKWLIDAFTAGENGYYLVISYVVVRFAADLVNNFREVTFANVAASAEVFIADKVFNHVQNLSLAFHLQRETGKIIRLCSRGSQSFAQILRMAIFQIIPLMIELGMVVVIIFNMFPWYFAVIVFGSIIMYLLVTYVVTEWRAKYFKEMNLKDQAYNQKATDALLNFETVKYFNAEKHEEERYMKALNDYKTSNVATTKSMVVLNLSQNIVVAAGFAANLIVASWQLNKGNISIGSFILINTYLLQVYQPLNFLGTFWRWIRQSMVDVEQIFELIEQEDVIKDEGDEVCQIKQGAIEFRDVCFKYSDVSEDPYIIEKLNFTVEAGQSVALVGATGSGKSTIMRLLYRFYSINCGQILIDGQDITNIQIKDLRDNIGIVPQDCVLFNDTIKYNIAYGAVKDEGFKRRLNDESNKAAEREVMKDIVDVSQKARIHGFVKDKPSEYYEKVGERGLKLSGGEKQRVAIARALLKSTPIMCFDEATSALDTQTEKKIQEAINEAAKGRTTLMIAHRLSTIKDCDKIIVLKNGVVHEQGSHDDLLSREGEYYTLWNRQSEKAELEQKEKKMEEEREAEREQLMLLRKGSSTRIEQEIRKKSE